MFLKLMDCILQSLLRLCLGKSALKSAGHLTDDTSVESDITKSICMFARQPMIYNFW